MSKPIVYMDECGHTGSNLEDANQPCFVVASHNFTEHESVNLIDEFFQDSNSTELKHTLLAKSSKGRKMVLSFLEGIDPSRVLLGIADKRYSLLLKLIEHILEPAMFHSGMNLYENGHHVRLASLWTDVLSRDKAFTTQLLSAFQAMVRDYSKVTEWNFRRLVFPPHPDRLIDEAVLCSLRKALTSLGDDDLAILEKGVLNLSQAVALPLVEVWKQRIGDFRLIHDESSSMSTDRKLWDLLTGPDAPPATIGGPGWSVTYPMNLEPMTFSSSITSAALQLADVLAGASVRYGNWKIRGGADEYAEKVEARFLLPAEAHTDRVFGTALFPLTPEQIEKLPPTPNGAGDAIEYSARAMEQILSRRKL